MSQLPSYEELPVLESGARSGWGVFGEDDNLGLFNLLTPERVARAAGLVRRGAMFSLDCELSAFAPGAVSVRGVPRHELIHARGTRGFDDVVDNLYLQGSSQWDSLGHVGYAPDAFYNGATESDILSAKRNTIEHWVRHGVAGRAVLLDMLATLESLGRGYDPSQGVTFSVEDLELARARSGVSFEPGDLLLLHTGYADWFLGQDVETRRSHVAALSSPGIEQSEAMCRYLWDAHVAAIISDNVAVEAAPFDRSPDAGAFSFLHPLLIGQFGLALGELWWLKDLASDCAADGVYECFLVSCPLHLRGGIGSPANAVAIK